jgi:hypothetical protein
VGIESQAEVPMRFQWELMNAIDFQLVELAGVFDATCCVGLKL